jgi:hypothetical protein
MVGLNPTLRVGRQVADAIRQRGRVDPRTLDIEVVEALEQVGLDDPALRARCEAPGWCQGSTVCHHALLTRCLDDVADQFGQQGDRVVARDMCDQAMKPHQRADGRGVYVRTRGSSSPARNVTMSSALASPADRPADARLDHRPRLVQRRTPGLQHERCVTRCDHPIRPLHHPETLHQHSLRRQRLTVLHLADDAPP